MIPALLPSPVYMQKRRMKHVFLRFAFFGCKAGESVSPPDTRYD